MSLLHVKEDWHAKHVITHSKKILVVRLLELQKIIHYLILDMTNVAKEKVFGNATI